MPFISPSLISQALLALSSLWTPSPAAPEESILHFSQLSQIAEVDERYQSVNVEMCEVVGGEFWIPYHLIDTARVKTEGLAALKRKIDPVDLYNPKLRKLTEALGPMYIRVSGTWANTTYFQNDDQTKLSEAPEGYENVLTRKEWKGVIDFVNSMDNELVTSFAISEGMRDENGNWTPAQIQPLVEYTHSIGGKIAAAEMFNEPSHAEYGGTPKGYSPVNYAEDFVAFSAFVQREIPEMKIMGPGSTGEGGILGEVHEMATDKILSQSQKPEFEIFSYHYYGGVSQRCRGDLSPKDALAPEWLQKTELGLEYYENARDEYLPNAPIWLTETAEAACGGNPWAATYIDTFRYLEQLGRLAKKGVKVVMHNTLAASEYALLEQYTFNPRPNYWAAWMWANLMGIKVYQSPYQKDGLDIFVHSLKNSEKGHAVMIVNPSESASSIQVSAPSKQYTLSADELLGKTVKLNGKELKLNADDSLPELQGVSKAKGVLEIPPLSIVFLAVEGE
ncbi:hypothetical protein J0A68_17605 [Algoriphagus sp. H41]|uniref:Glycosyl hydrolase family 79, N-terminal domain n=1 Tax=Algoriphagus oliviformis TaxID=2811231 RepID=A0ABS3C7G6_9BACT|nr:hypothetical protein [Algoriphagus oliviformis]MBN7812775.1 hypothetical protein [Algoriphagus oliviformis]